MKRLILAALALLALLASLTGCGAKQPGEQSSAIDIDLTALSSTMVYSEVFNMMATPDQYVGKTIKMAGGYSSFRDESTGAVYHVCMIADASACCTQGMEFILREGESYPPLESDITVVGTFQLYDENGTTYCHLVDAEFV